MSTRNIHTSHHGLGSQQTVGRDFMRFAQALLAKNEVSHVMSTLLVNFKDLYLSISVRVSVLNYTTYELEALTLLFTVHSSANPKSCPHMLSDTLVVDVPVRSSEEDASSMIAVRTVCESSRSSRQPCKPPSHFPMHLIWNAIFVDSIVDHLRQHPPPQHLRIRSHRPLSSSVASLPWTPAQHPS